jgi:hypothetical protein
VAFDAAFARDVVLPLAEAAYTVMGRGPAMTTLPTPRARTPQVPGATVLLGANLQHAGAPQRGVELTQRNAEQPSGSHDQRVAADQLVQ